MPEKEKRPIWERQDNRKKVFSALLRKPMTFTELLETTNLSKATLSSHLKKLQKENMIERTIDKRIYRVILNENRLIDEIKATTFDVLMELLKESNLSEIAQIFEEMVRIVTINIIELKKREALGEQISSMRSENKMIMLKEKMKEMSNELNNYVLALEKESIL
jgi:DNA-binding transcriptional regulator GbsR (MarR family)